MTDLDSLYRELILDHSRHPRNHHQLPTANREAKGYNPLCGDRITVFVRIEDGVIADIAFEGTGCAISTASASMMTDNLKGKTLDEAKRLFQGFHDMVTAESDADGGEARLGKLDVFSGVRRFPARVKCATLAWHTAKAAFEDRHEEVSTE